MYAVSEQVPHPMDAAHSLAVHAFHRACAVSSDPTCDGALCLGSAGLAFCFVGNRGPARPLPLCEREVC